MRARVSKTLLVYFATFAAFALWTRNSAYITWPLLLGLYWELIDTALNANPYRRERPERERDIETLLFASSAERGASLHSPLHLRTGAPQLPAQLED